MRPCVTTLPRDSGPVKDPDAVTAAGEGPTIAAFGISPTTSPALLVMLTWTARATANRPRLREIRHCQPRRSGGEKRLRENLPQLMSARVPRKGILSVSSCFAPVRHSSRNRAGRFPHPGRPRYIQQHKGNAVVASDFDDSQQEGHKQNRQISDLPG